MTRKLPGISPIGAMLPRERISVQANDTFPGRALTPGERNLGLRGKYSRKIARILLALVFVISFLQYFVEVTRAIQLVPVGMLIVVAILVAASASFPGLKNIISSLYAPWFLFVFVLIIPLLRSFAAGSSDEIWYTFAIITTLIAIRVLLSSLSIDDVFVAYARAALVSTTLLLVAS